MRDENLKRIPGYNEYRKAYETCYDLGKQVGRIEGIKESMELISRPEMQQ